MDKILIDTNVLLDHALNRKDEQPEEANEILELAEFYSIEACISQASLFTLTYVLRKALGKTKSDKALTGYLSFLKLISLNNKGANLALQLDAKDTEDAFQYFTALENNWQFFVTRNEKDFEKIKTKKLWVLSPDDLLRGFYDFRIT